MAGSRAGASTGGETSLDAAMREPSETSPEVVVIDSVDEEDKTREFADPKKDLYLSTVDGRYQSAIIPVRVGPHAEVFPVHRDILTKSEYFRRALDGEFREAEDQAIDLPEEDPSIFSFVVAFLYEEKFVPIRPVASVLVAEPDKGKGREVSDDNSGTDSSYDGSASDESNRSRNRRRQEARRRREARAWEQRMRKEPGRHRPDCACASCTSEIIGPPCWNCGHTRRPPPPRPGWYNGPPPPRPGVPPPPMIVVQPRAAQRNRHRSRTIPPPVEPPPSDERMSPEDLRTWCQAYSLSVDVYVCAERFLMSEFKACISAYIINNFEIAGLDAAQPSVLHSCKTLSAGLSPHDALLKKILARVGFLQARLRKNFPDEYTAFFAENPELAVAILAEMCERREEDVRDDLPAMERPIPLPPPPRDDHHFQGPRRRYDNRIYR